MSRVVLCLVALGLMSASAVAQLPPPPRPPPVAAPARDVPLATGTAIVRGKVIAAGSEKALAHVEVRAVSGALRVNKAVLTDANGRYEIADLPAGRFTITTNKTNYVRASYGQQRALGPGKPIEIANGQVVERIDLVLQHTGVIAGRITDEFGDPAPDVQVMPMRYQMINGERRLINAGTFSTANDLGEYRLFGLAPGTYFVSAVLRNFNMGDSADRSAYAPTFYPGTGNMAEAQKLTVAPGQTITGVNLTLQPIQAVRISGVALDIQGRPLIGAYVNVMQRVGMMPMGGNGGMVKPDGSFSVGGVTPGEYTLRATPPGGGIEEFAALDISVAGGGDITDVQLQLTKASTIRGRVVFEAGDVKPPVASALRVTAQHPNTFSAMAGNTVPKDDLTFEMKTSAGHVQIRTGISGTGAWRMKRVLAAGLDVTDSGLEIPANATLEDVVIEMTSRHAELTGTVRDGAGDQIKDCVVVIFAQDPQRWTGQTRYYGTSRPDADGVFHMRPTPGDYYVVAFEEFDNSAQFNDSDVLRQLIDRATKLSIADGDTTKLELTLSPPPIY